MFRWGRWRTLAAQRSGRAQWLIFLGIIGIIIFATALILSNWSLLITRWGNELFVLTPQWLILATQWLMQFNPLQIATASAGALAIGALIFYFFPLPRTHSYLVTNPRRIPDIAVYVDLENRLPVEKLPKLIKYAHAFVEGHRADLVFFGDSTLSYGDDNYRLMRQGGFRLVDVPHKRQLEHEGDSYNSKNAVDMEMSLYAYQQALLSPKPMKIAIVSSDRDYIPLVRRLWEEGHEVEVWSNSVSIAMKTLVKLLGGKRAKVLSFAEMFSETTSDMTPSQPVKVIKSAKQTKQTKSAPSTSAATLEKTPPLTTFPEPAEASSNIAPTGSIATHTTPAAQYATPISIGTGRTARHNTPTVMPDNPTPHTLSAVQTIQSTQSAQSALAYAARTVVHDNFANNFANISMLRAASTQPLQQLDRERLADTLTRSRHILEQTNARYGDDPGAMVNLGSLLGNQIKPRAAAMGFNAPGWVSKWKFLMIALGIYISDSNGNVTPGYISSNDAAETLLCFLAELSATAKELAQETPDRPLAYAVLTKRIGETDGSDPATARLRNLLLDQPADWPNPVAIFLRSAATYGFIHYEQVPNRPAITVLAD